MQAYPDAKCCFGYMTVCDRCVAEKRYPYWVDIHNPVANPPACGKVQRCECCDKQFRLEGAEMWDRGYDPM